jgi:hypothetical protein
MLPILMICLETQFYPAPAENPDKPPLEINFKSCCGLPPDFDDVYDSRTKTYHINFFRYGTIAERINRASEFVIVKTAKSLPKNLSFRLTGMPNRSIMPLRLTVGEEFYALEPNDHDSKLFRVERSNGVTKVEFTAKGLTKLQPGTRISFTEMTW